MRSTPTARPDRPPDRPSCTTSPSRAHRFDRPPNLEVEDGEEGDLDGVSDSERDGDLYLEVS